MSNKLVLVLLNIIAFNFGLVAIAMKERPLVVPPVIVQDRPKFTPIKIQPEPPVNYTLSNPTPAYLDNEATWGQLQQWHQEAPKLTEVGTYGKSSAGRDIHYIRVTNQSKPNRKVVLITACIHGNEPWSSSVVMNYIGTMLDKYGDDPQITDLLDTRDIYFVPIVSPDSYPHSRRVDGVDPNRDFPTAGDPNKVSVPPVRALQEFFLKIKPNAVVSGHTYGRIFLHPWGDQTQRSPNDEDFKRVVGETGRLCQYRVIRACEMYGSPIYGSEVDWYYRNGAFPVVMEFGSHQQIPSRQDIDSEFNRTFKGILYFMKDAPEIQIQQFWWVRRAA